METPTANFIICYNVTPNPALSIPIPNAYLVAIEDNVLGYIEKLALSEVLDSYNIAYKETAHEQLLEICQLLKPESLAQKFQPKRKKVATLADIMKDAQLKPVVMQYVDRKLSAFYHILTTKNYPLCYNAQRREPIPNSLITRVQHQLEPLISFEKTNEGIHYKLQLGADDTIFKPYEHSIITLQDQPAQLLINRKWYTLKHLNAKKLTPFLTKETVFIPAKNTKLYFEKFISSILKKVAVQAEGFTIDVHNTIQNYSLELYYDFFLKKAACHVQFNYQDTLFSSYESRKTATEIRYLEDDIALNQIKRDPKAELEILQKLTQLGLKEESGKLYLEETSTDEYELVTWLSKNATQIKQLGFTIKPIKLDQKNIIISDPEIQLNTTEQNDWFDIKGLVQIGVFSIPFAHFIPLINKKERFFELPDETYFIIPNSWMTTYKQLSQFATVEHDQLQLRKNNFKVLEGLPLKKK